MRWSRLLLACALLPPLLTAWLIARFGVDLPFWDEWVHLQTLVKFEAGTLTWADLFAQYNESRKPFPRLLILLLAHPFAADQRAQMAVTWLLAALTLALIAVLARQSGLHHRPGTHATVLLTASTLLFSWTQWQNWLWGIQFICLLPLACLSAVLVACGSPRWGPATRVTLAVVACLIATYSFASGMVIWPLCGLALWAIGGVGWRGLSVFALTGAVAIGVYFHGYVSPAWTPDWSDALADPARFASYVVLLAGGGLVPAEASAAARLHRLLMPAVLGGLVLLLALPPAALALLRRDRAAVPWALIAGYALAAMLLAALGRSPFGLDTALLSRYATFSLPAGLAAVALLALRPHSRPVRVTRTALAAALIAATLISSAAVLPRIEDIHRRQLTGRAMLAFCLTSPDARQTTLVADWPQHDLIVPTAVTLSAAGLMSPPVSPDGDPRPLLAPDAPPATARLRDTTLLLDDPDIHTVLIVAPPQPEHTAPAVVRVLHAATAFGKDTPFAELPPLPPGAELLALRGSALQAVPIRLLP